MPLLQHPEYLFDPGVPPLSTPPGTGQPVAHRVWREARERALAAVRAGDGLILVLGPPGTGKSTLLRDLARALGDAGYDALLQPRGDLLSEAAEAAPGGPGQPRPRVVLIDEADRMDGAGLGCLRLFGARCFVLAGLGSAEGGLDRLAVPATVVRLAPLHPDEVGAFAAARLARAGGHATPLDGGAVSRLAERSGGVPRVLDMLVGAAAFLAATEGAARIEASHIDRAAALRDGGDETPAAPPVRAGASDAGHRETEREAGADARAGTPPAPPLIGRPARGRAAAAWASLWAVPWTALCAAAGVVALCGWLALRPGEHARDAQPTPARSPAPSVEAPEADRPDGAGTDAGPGPGAAPPPPGIAPGVPPAVAPSAAPASDTSPAAPDAAPASPATAPPAAPDSATAPRPASPGEAGSPAAEALPAAAPAHVVVYHASGDAEAAARAAGLARALRAAGMSVDDPVATARRAGKPGVRYFFAEDQETAGAVLRRAGLSAESLLTGAARPGFLPRPGVIEVTVPPG